MVVSEVWSSSSSAALSVCWRVLVVVGGTCVELEK